MWCNFLQLLRTLKQRWQVCKDSKKFMSGIRRVVFEKNKKPINKNKKLEKKQNWENNKKKTKKMLKKRNENKNRRTLKKTTMM